MTMCLRLTLFYLTMRLKQLNTLKISLILLAILLKKDAAYVVDGEVFFRVASDPEYGILSNINHEDLMSGARVEENSKKENPADFLLWKKTEVGIKWNSPWGQGRPGWHTECVGDDKRHL